MTIDTARFVQIDCIIKGVLDREGWPVYTAHPADRGGPTKGGITLKTLSSWRQSTKTRPCKVEHLKGHGEDEAIRILRRRYVETNGIDRIPDPDLLEQVVDSSVLSGPYLAVKDLQRAVSAEADGIVGPQTLYAISDYGYKKTGSRLAVERSLRLTRHVAKNPDQLVFLVGWLNRSLGFIS